MAQPVLLKLSPAEWMLCVMTVQPESDAVLAQTVNRTMSPEHLQGALQAARDALLARDLARLTDEGKLDINPVVRMCTRAVLNPHASFGLTQIEEDGTSRVVFYNWLPGFAIGTWVDANQIRSFQLLDGDQMIAQQVGSLYRGDGSEPPASMPAETKTVTIRASALPALPVDRREKVNGLAAILARGGLSAEDAARLERAFMMPNRRAVMAAASNASPVTRTLMWLPDGDHVYLIAQDTNAADVTVTRTNMTGWMQMLTVFVRDVLATVSKV